MTLAHRLIAVANLAGLCAGLAGGVLLALSLSLKSTEFTLGTVNGEIAICHNGKVVQAGFGGPLVDGDQPCPKEFGATPAIVTNSVGKARAGLYLIVLGFILQLPAAIRSVFCL